jgi:hypothetical protein
MSAFADLVRFVPTLGGTTDWVFSGAVGGCQSPAAAGAVNGVSYKVYAVSNDLTQWEVSTGIYSSASGTFPRTTVLYNSLGTGTAAGQSGAGTKISFSTVPQVSVVALAEDLARKNGPLNILDFGGVADGTTANDTAFAAAWTALGTKGGCIYFPGNSGIGKYSFTSQITKTLPNTQFSIQLAGDGIGATTLYWPNASGGIQLTAGSGNNSFNIHDLSMTTAQVNSGNTLHFIGVAQGNNPTSVIQNVQINGDDLNGVATSTKYWAIGIWIHGWSAINLVNVNTYGPFNPTPGGAGGGVGLVIEGDAPTSLYATLINVQMSSFNAHQYGISLGGFWQGIAVGGATQFNGGEAGSAAIHQVSGASGVLTDLNISNCEFAYGGNQILIESGISNVQIIGNQIGATAGNYAVQITTGIFYNITGNFITGPATGGGIGATGGASSYGVITGNVFQGFGSNIAVLLNTGATHWTVAINTYNGPATNVANAGGTSNSIGTAAAGNMTGVVP